MDTVTLANAAQRNLGGPEAYEKYTAAVNEALATAGCTTELRAAHFLSQIFHESAGLKYWRELDPGHYLEGRTDLGNTQPGDGPRFRGAGPIQLTGRNNFLTFSKWCHAKGLISDPELFIKQPELVAEPRWGMLAAVHYWTVQRPQLNSLADADDLIGVTRAINGGTHGLDDRRQRYQHIRQLGSAILPTGVVRKPVVEKVLDYPRDQVKQETFYWCGPASSQTIIRSKTGALHVERELADQLGTTENGTDHIGLFPRVLNKYMPDAKYTAVEMPNDPPTFAQTERLWRDVTNSVDGGYGVVANIVAPPSNYPRGVNGSQSPAYSGGTVYHYIALMGYRDDNGTRSYWVADSGFSPYGYWCSHEQMSSLIPPKGYVAATTQQARAEPTKVIPTPDAGRPAVPKTDSQKIAEIRDQLVGWDGRDGFPGWSQLGGLSLVDAVAAIGAKLGLEGFKDPRKP